MPILLITLVITFIISRVFKIQLAEFGFIPTVSRFKDFLFGFFTSGIVGALGYYLLIRTFDYHIAFNSEYTFTRFINGLWWTFRSVLIEELIFRGVLLMLVIKVLGKHKACILSSLIFGIYHWFSYEVFGDLISMLHTFLITFIGGIMFAYAFTETKSMYLPIALHFGWNLVSVVILSEGQLGDQLLISSGGKPMGYFYFGFLLYQILILPLFTFLYLRFSKYQTNDWSNSPIKMDT